MFSSCFSEKEGAVSSRTEPEVFNDPTHHSGKNFVLKRRTNKLSVQDNHRKVYVFTKLAKSESDIEVVHQMSQAKAG